MLKLHIVAVGDKMPDWVVQGFEHYARRIRGRFALRLIEIAAEKRRRNAPLARLMQAEEKKIKARIPPGSVCIALDRHGQHRSTTELAQTMAQWLQQGRQAALIIGGPEGLSREMLSACDAVWSLSALTLAHPVARVVVAEQLFRCCAILDNQPYHRSACGGN